MTAVEIRPKTGLIIDNLWAIKFRSSWALLALVRYPAQVAKKSDSLPVDLMVSILINPFTE